MKEYKQDSFYCSSMSKSISKCIFVPEGTSNISLIQKCYYVCSSNIIRKSVFLMPHQSELVDHSDRAKNVPCPWGF